MPETTSAPIGDRNGFEQPSSLRFAASWLALREMLDHEARNRSLPQALADRLPDEPRLVDLGSGTGSLFRFMAPIIGRSQSWILADFDGSLLNIAMDRIAAWGARRGFTGNRSDRSGQSGLVLITPLGRWRVETLVTDLQEAPYGLPLGGVDAVACSALLDLTSWAWMERLIAALCTPFYASMTVDGRDLWLPRHPGDRAVRAAFQHDQRRDKGLGPALGNDAPDAALQLLAARRFEIHAAESDWRIPRTPPSIAGRFVRMTGRSAHRAAPAQAKEITAWTRTRLRQAQKEQLSIRIGHRDILAFPQA